MNNALTQKQQFWKTHLDAAARSGLSIADYAKANQLKPQTLYQWRSTLKGRSVTVSTQIPFTQVVSSTTVSGRPLTIVLGEATSRFERLPDPDWFCPHCSLVSGHDAFGGSVTPGVFVYTARGLQKVHYRLVAPG